MGDGFHIGEWVFCEFTLHQIKAMDGVRVTEVSDGACSHSGYDLTDRCKPLTMEMKRIADTYEWQSQRIHREGSPGLNFPDIHRWLVDQWVLACGHTVDTNALRADYERLHVFTADVLTKQNVESGYGFALLRGR